MEEKYDPNQFPEPVRGQMKQVYDDMDRGVDRDDPFAFSVDVMNLYNPLVWLVVDKTITNEKMKSILDYFFTLEREAWDNFEKNGSHVKSWKYNPDDYPEPVKGQMKKVYEMFDSKKYEERPEFFAAKIRNLIFSLRAMAGNGTIDHDTSRGMEDYFLAIKGTVTG